MEAGSSTSGADTSVSARAALAGNPSDGHGGAVVAVPLPCWTATATVVGAGEFAVAGSTPGDDLWELTAAACRSLVTIAGAPAAATAVELDISTSIPRSVGLAGSSALVLAVLRAVAKGHPGEPWESRLHDPAAIAVVAHQAEVAELGIAAGMQDRLVQAHRVPVLMDFSPDATTSALGHPCGLVRALDQPPGRWLVALRPTTAESSGVVHAGLARRATSTDPIIAGLAAAAHLAADAIDRGDLASLGVAMDQTFDLRSELLDLDVRHVEMVDAVRQAGGHANYTGSGGAVIALCHDEASERAAVDALTALEGCTIRTDPFGPADTADGQAPR